MSKAIQNHPRPAGTMSIITLKALLDDDEFEAKVAKAKADIARGLAKRQCAAAQEHGR